MLLTKQVELLCEARGDTALTTMVQDLVFARSADMLVVPTDTFGQQTAGKETVGSMSATLLRNIKDVSLLLVKANSVGNAHKSSSTQGAAVQKLGGQHAVLPCSSPRINTHWVDCDLLLCHCDCRAR